jgi:hypothetical protein
MKLYHPLFGRILWLGAYLASLFTVTSCVHENTRTLAPGLSQSGVSKM